jgi:tetratricopeptide (TPR) repeat protein
MVGNGFNEARRYGEAFAFFDRALKVSRENPDAGFPYMAYEGKAQTLAAEGRLAEAREILDYALRHAMQNGKSSHQSQLLIEEGEYALRAGDRYKAIEYLEEAGNVARQHALFRIAAHALFT